MMRQSSSRNHRSRGWKVKHVLQVCLLLAVCVWLLYQVKHSHDKKKALEEGTLKVSDRVEESRPEFLKLGRKDPQVNTVVTAMDSTIHKEEDENEEAEEAAEQENKREENEEEDGRGAGDDEIDESDQEERADDEAEGGEEFGDAEDKEGQSEDVGLLENGDHEDEEGKFQGAREEHYKADDASSAVVRDTQEVVQENADLGVGNLDEEPKENSEEVELENDVRTNGTEVASKDEEVHDVPANGENQLNNSIPLNDTALTGKEPEIESLHNSTVVLESTGHIEERSSTTSNSSNHLEQNANPVLFEPNNQSKQQSNSTGTVPDEHKEAQSVPTGNNTETVNSVTVESVAGNETANLDSTQDQSKENKMSNLTERNSISENVLVEQTQKSNMTEGVEESDESHNVSSNTNGDGDSLQGEATSSLGDASAITEEEREAQMDLSTLPDIQIKTRKEEEIAAE